MKKKKNVLPKSRRSTERKKENSSLLSSDILINRLLEPFFEQEYEIFPGLLKKEKINRKLIKQINKKEKK